MGYQVRMLMASELLEDVRMDRREKYLLSAELNTNALWLCQNSYWKSLVIFNSYVKLPEGIGIHSELCSDRRDMFDASIICL